MKMSTIVKLKVEEIENVVGGIMADALTATANARFPTQDTNMKMPPMPAPESSNRRSNKR